MCQEYNVTGTHCTIICSQCYEIQSETAESIYETVDDVDSNSGSDMIENADYGFPEPGVVNPVTSDNMAYGVTRRVVTSLNPAYEAMHLQ